jgi:hypothetical protein
MQAELEAVLKQLSELHLPKIEEIERAFNLLEGSVSDSEPSQFSSPIWQLVKRMV